MEDKLIEKNNQIFNRTSFYLQCSNSFQTPKMSFDNKLFHIIFLLEIISVDSPIIFSVIYLEDI